MRFERAIQMVPMYFSWCQCLILENNCKKVFFVKFQFDLLLTWKIHLTDTFVQHCLHNNQTLLQVVHWSLNDISTKMKVWRSDWITNRVPIILWCYGQLRPYKKYLLLCNVHQMSKQKLCHDFLFIFASCVLCLLLWFTTFVALRFVFLVIHYLRYIDTATTGSIGFPEFVDVTMVDGVMVSSYDSYSQKMLPKQDWVKELDQQEWEAESFHAQRTQKDLRKLIKSLKQINQTEGELTHCLGKSLSLFYMFMCYPPTKRT